MKHFNYLGFGIFSELESYGNGDVLDFLEKNAHTLPLDFASYTPEQKKAYKQKNAPYFVCGLGVNHLKEGKTVLRRSDDNLKKKHTISLDFDKGTEKKEDVKKKALKLGFNFALFDTISSTKETPKFRLVFPLAKGLERAEALKSVSILADALNVSSFDNSSATFSQLQGLPFTPTENHEEPFFYRRGVLLDFEAFKAEREPREEPTAKDKDEDEQEPPETLHKTEKEPIKRKKAPNVSRVDEFKEYLHKNKKRLTTDGNTYNNALGVITTIAKARQENELSEAEALECLKLLASGRADWENGNLKKYMDIISKGEPIRTLYNWNTRILYGQGEDIDFKAVGLATVSIPSNLVIFTKDGKPRGVVANFQTVEEFFTANGVKICFDVISKKSKIRTSEKTPELFKEFVNVDIANAVQQLFTFYRLPISPTEAKNAVAVLLQKNLYNPAREKIEKLYSETDTQTRESLKKQEETEKLFSCFEFKDKSEEDKNFYLGIFKKFLFQAVALIHNDEREPFGNDFILILQGGQGIGKSLFSRRFGSALLGAEYFTEGLRANQLDTKDEALKFYQCLIGELAEFAPSSKIVETLKDVITQATTKIRPPYAVEPVNYLKHSSYIATTNRDDIITDDENRRFVIFPLEDVKIAKMLKIDFVRIWLESYSRYKEETEGNNRHGFRLTKEERQRLKGDNLNFRRDNLNFQLFLSNYDIEEPRGRWRFETFSSVAFVCGISATTTHGKDYRELKKELLARGYEFKRGTGNRTMIKVPRRKEGDFFES